MEALCACLALTAVGRPQPVACKKKDFLIYTNKSECLDVFRWQRYFECDRRQLST